MPTSRSRGPVSNSPPAAAAPRIVRPLVLIAAIAVLAVVVIELPASMLRRFLPARVFAEDFSGTVWHGSAGNVSLDGRNWGALEWHLHPAPLLRLTVAADLRWVKVGFVADGGVVVTSRGATLRNLSGGGPIEDLHDLGVARGWRGMANGTFSLIEVALVDGGPVLKSVVGDATVTSLSSAEVAGGTDLGGYELHVADPTLSPGANVEGTLRDTGGPLELSATLQLSPDGHSGMLSGSVNTRADAPQSLRRQVDELAQLHARDARGAIPVDLEFTL